MNSYYLVPTSEYERKVPNQTEKVVDAMIQKSQVPGKFDQLSKQILNTPHLSEEDRAEELKDALNKYLNFKAASKIRFDEDLGILVKRVLDAVNHRG